jgi:hypothetical protein
MDAKTKTTLTMVAVGVGAFFAVRYLLNNRNENKSNASGKQCNCANGKTVAGCRRSCYGANGCCAIAEKYNLYERTSNACGCGA